MKDNSAPRSPSAKQAFAYALYYGLAAKLPRSDSKGGRFAAAARRRAAGVLLDRSGAEVNVEHRAYFGSGRHIELGDRSGIGVFCELHGPVTIGSDVMMGPYCMIIAMNHSFEDTMAPMNTQGFDEPQRVVIEDDVWMGACVIVTAGVRIGRGSVIGAASVVTKDVPPFSIVAGVPGRVIRSRLPDNP